tara:strand:+ start:733 stop:1311 length:579 start_codon:yes stop_codon:yes gene_type:complete
MEPLNFDEINHTGDFLIAAPHLADPGFHKTLVLCMKQQSDGGIMGLILNRLTTMSVQKSWKETVNEDCQSEEYLYVGGPVASPIIVLHTIPIYGESEIIDGVYFSVEGHNLASLVNITTDGEVAFYLGYAGWSPGQLEYEMSTGSWLKGDFDKKYIFENDPRMWETALKEYGNKYLKDVFGIKHIPDQANVN